MLARSPAKDPHPRPFSRSKTFSKMGIPLSKKRSFRFLERGTEGVRIFEWMPGFANGIKIRQK
jgi:hypothetical protein